MRPPGSITTFGMPSIAVPATVSPRKQRHRRTRSRRTFGQRMVSAVVTWLVLSALVAGIVAIYRVVDHTVTATAHPKQWDPRVAEYAAFVEHERGRTFQHPVYVDFVAEADFVALFDPVELADETAGQSSADADVESELADAEGLSTSFDPVADEATVSQVSLLGFYNPSIDRIIIRGDDLTPAVQSVLVHELTHALQQQWFTMPMGGPDDMEIRAVVEADAMRVEDAYVKTLTGDDQTEAIADNSMDEATKAALSDVPWALVDTSQAPYILGPMFVQFIIDQAGAAAVDGLFDDFPSSEELIDPYKYLDKLRVRDVPVPEVDVPAGAVVVSPQAEWPMYEALVMLDAWLPWRESRDVLSGWAAGGTVSYRKDGADGPVCFATAVDFDSEQDAQAYSVAINEWAAAAGSSAVPTAASNQVQFEACARADSAVDPPRPTLMTSEAVYLEHLIYVQLGDVDHMAMGSQWYTCVSRAMMDDSTFTSLVWTDELTDEQQASITLAAETARWICGAPPLQLEQ